MSFVFIAIAILLIYLLFVVSPATVMFFIFFSHKNTKTLKERNLKNTYMEPFIGQISTAASNLSDHIHCNLITKGFDGSELNASFYDSGSEKTVIMMHGFNCDPMINFSVQAIDFIDSGFNVLIPCERAHNENKSNYTGFGLLEQYDVLSWIKKIRSDKIGKIVLYGISMGASAIAYSSDKIPADSGVSAIVLDCGFTSPSTLLKFSCKRKHLPAFLLMPVIRFLGKIIIKVDIKRKATIPLSKNKVPVFVIHGKNDTTVPVENGHEIFQSIRSAKESFFVDEAEHTLGYLVGGNSLKKHLYGFINNNIKINGEN